MGGNSEIGPIAGSRPGEATQQSFDGAMKPVSIQIRAAHPRRPRMAAAPRHRCAMTVRRFMRAVCLLPAAGLITLAGTPALASIPLTFDVHGGTTYHQVSTSTLNGQVVFQGESFFNSPPGAPIPQLFTDVFQINGYESCDPTRPLTDASTTQQDQVAVHFGTPTPPGTVTGVDVTIGDATLTDFPVDEIRVNIILTQPDPNNSTERVVTASGTLTPAPAAPGVDLHYLITFATPVAVDGQTKADVVLSGTATPTLTTMPSPTQPPCPPGTPVQTEARGFTIADLQNVTVALFFEDGSALRHDAAAVRIQGDKGHHVKLFSRCATSIVTDCLVTQDHKLVVQNKGDHEDEILTVYSIFIPDSILFPKDCTVNGMAPNVFGAIQVFSDLSSYAAGERKTFPVRVIYSCPARLEARLTGAPVRLTLEVDHLGDDIPFRNPDDDDDVPADNFVIENKTLE
jgi:hypothetical protein